MEYQKENQPVENRTHLKKQIKHYLIPVLSVFLVITFFSVIGYICFSSPDTPEKIKVTVDDMTIEKKDIPEKSEPTITEETPIKVVVTEEVAPLEMTTTETIKTDYSKIEIPETVTPAPTPQPKPVVQAEKPAPKKVTPSKPKPVVKKQSSPRFYIQVGSFSTLANAEKAQQMLSDKEIKSIIETRKINNKTWYRVLIGAYASKAEAERFKPSVQNIKGFEGAMIREYY